MNITSALILPRRILVLLFLGFASGLPLALTSSTLSAWFTKAGMSLLNIGLLTLVGQPYIYKFIWAPLVDRYDPLKMGKRRSWLLLTQILVCLTLAFMAHLNPAQTPGLVAACALLTAFFSATQDIASSAYLAEAPKAEERGLAAGLYMTGYRIALIISGALALIMAEYFGWNLTYYTMAALMLIGMFTVFMTPEPSTKQNTLPHPSFKSLMLDPFRELWQRFTPKYRLLFALLIPTYNLTDNLAMALNSVMLLRDLHFSLAEVGIVNKAFGLSATIIGVMLAGVLMRKIKLFPALLIFGVLQALSHLAFIWLYDSGHNLNVLAVTVFSVNICTGLATTAFLALIINLCHKDFAGTQFAVLTALMALGRVYIGPLAALLVAHLGWPIFYAISTLIGFISLLLLLPLKNRLNPENKF